jgi:hypothetical protein
MNLDNCKIKPGEDIRLSTVSTGINSSGVAKKKIKKSLQRDTKKYQSFKTN